MAEKHRFKKNREFKQRLEETEQNEEADIRSFTFHRHELKKDSREFRKTRGDREDRDERSSRNDRKGGYKGNANRGGHERFDRSGKGRSFGKGKDFDKKNRRFDDED